MPSAPTFSRRTRRGYFVAVLLAALAIISAASLVGRCFVWNLSSSLPRGLYVLDRSAAPRRGTVVSFQPPPAVAALIVRRAYLPPGVSLIKVVVALPSDSVRVDESTVSVNGRVLGPVARCDSAGRVLVPFLFDGQVPTGYAFVATTAPLSFDSRYFGFVPLSSLTVAERVDLLAIVLACSLHPDDTLVTTLVDVQSGGNIYFVGDLATLKTNDTLTSSEAALRFAEELRRHGGRPAVGLLGVPLDWAYRYGRSPIELFDGCTNIAVATAAFAEYQDRCSPNRPHADRPRSGGRRRRGRRTFEASVTRSCILALFARDLGLASTPAAILSRIVPGQGPKRVEIIGASPQRSGVFAEGAGNAAPADAGRTSLPIFLDPPANAVEPR
jgi:conjugative transfer signal peptidase TraF